MVRDLRNAVMEVNTVFGNGNRGENFHQTIAFMDDTGVEDNVVNLYPEIEYQTLEGFGGAITEAAGYVYSLLSDVEKKELMHAYFSKEGMHYALVRIHIDSCDFCLDQYCALNDEKDPEKIDLSRIEKYILPMLRDAYGEAEKNGIKLKIMLSPWSPPAFMKSNKSRIHGGRLLKEYYGAYADYLCRYIIEFQKYGFEVSRMSMQNEPNASQTWDSCVWSASEQKEFLRDYLYPQMQKCGLENIEIFLWDHNKERLYENMRDIIDEETDKMVAGAAFHWYSGDHFEALDLAGRIYPDKKLILSESCIELCKFDRNDGFKAACSLAHEMIGDLEHGMSAFYDWNMLLNSAGGPHHVENDCLSPFMYDEKRKRLEENLIAKYYRVIAGKIVSGSVRIASTKYTQDIDVTSWKRQDDSIVMIILNKTDENKKITVRINGKIAETLVYPHSISSLEI